MPATSSPRGDRGRRYGQLGELQRSAHGPALNCWRMKPDFAATAREEFGKWIGPASSSSTCSMGSARRGWRLPDESPPTSGAIVLRRPTRASARAEEGFWVAVLPFKYSGANADLTALADGLTEDIVTGLSRFSYLRVIARSSTSRYVNEAVDVRAAGKELGARYVMEGTLRQAGAEVAPRGPTR